MQRGLWGRMLAVSALVVSMVVSAVATEPAGPVIKSGSPNSPKYNPAYKTIELFDGMRDGSITVRMIAKDATAARLLVTNRTKEPLNVKLPDVFAGVHVLAQRGLFPPFNQNNNMNAPGMAQPISAMPQQQGQQNNNNNFLGNGVMCVPAERIAAMELDALCLVHGKPDPQSSMTYEVRPLDTVTNKPGVEEICLSMAQGKLDRRAAQAAVWHLNNEMSWETLAAKEIKPLVGKPYPYFDSATIRAGRTAADDAVKTADAKALARRQRNAGESTSSASPAK